MQYKKFPGVSLPIGQKHPIKSSYLFELGHESVNLSLPVSGFQKNSYVSIRTVQIGLDWTGSPTHARELDCEPYRRKMNCHGPRARWPSACFERKTGFE